MTTCQRIAIIVVYISTVGACLTNTELYRWTCSKDGKCNRIHSDYIPDNRTLWDTQNICRLSCGKYGSLWPRPTGNTLIGNQVIPFNPLDMRFDIQEIPEQTREHLNEIVEYFLGILKEECKNCTESLETDVTVRFVIRSIDLTLNWNTNESYSLNISTSKNSHVTVLITAETVYGARHGLETLSQLISFQPETCDLVKHLVLIQTARIKDQPMFTHRGLMLDTARNFIPILNIKRTLDGMAASKLNIFHWHITDSQSFPLEIVTVPQMTRYGAYDPKNIYRKNDVMEIISYAKIRGIRVILELDTPSHAGNGWQWGDSLGLGDLAVCVNQQPWRSFCIQPPCGQLNPANSNLYKVLRDIYKAIIDILPTEKVLHMGGDEVFFGCWNSSVEILQLLKDKGHGRETKDFLQLWAEFQATSLRIWDEETGSENCSPTDCRPPNKVILWSSHLTDVLHIEKYLQKDRYIIQTWVESTNVLPADLVAKGYNVIMSTKNAWYLDHGFWGITTYYSWRKVYENRIPRIKGVLGGEVCMWSEYVDENSLDARIWPRAAAAAERLWTDPDTEVTFAEPRFYSQRQRLVNRGLHADSVTPKYCVQNEGECT